MIIDFRTYRIPNRLTLPGFFLGIGIRWYLYGLPGVGQGAAGCLIAILALLALFMFRVLGAGDIKLLAVVGAFTGFGIWNVLLYTCICTGVLGIMKLLHVWITDRNGHPEEAFPDRNGHLRGTRMHMSLPIALGSVMFMAGGW